MFERFTEPSRRLMGLCRHEAQLMGHEYMGTEHLLAAWTQQSGTLAAELLKGGNVTLARVREEIARLRPPGPSGIQEGQMPFSPRLKRAIEVAAEEAERLHQGDRMTPDHLFLGVLQVPETLAGLVLERCGARPSELRDRMLKRMGVEADPAWSDAVRAVWGFSVAEAKRLLHPTVEPGHLLLGLLDEPGPAKDLLSRSGVDREKVLSTLPPPPK